MSSTEFGSIDSVFIDTYLNPSRRLGKKAVASLMVIALGVGAWLWKGDVALDAVHNVQVALAVKETPRYHPTNHELGRQAALASMDSKTKLPLPKISSAVAIKKFSTPDGQNTHRTIDNPVVARLANGHYEIIGMNASLQPDIEVWDLDEADVMVCAPTPHVEVTPTVLGINEHGGFADRNAGHLRYDAAQNPDLPSQCLYEIDVRSLGILALS